MSKYKAILTTAGAAKIAAASAGGKPLKIDRLAAGDGNGKLPTPTPAQTKLINERYRAALNSLTVDKTAPDRLIAELIIPANVGGFWLREMGLYDADGVLIAVSNMAESYKPKLEEGSGRTQTLRMVLIVSHTEAITLIVSGDMVMATRDFVAAAIDDHAKSRNHPDASTAAKGFVQLSSVTNSASETLAATPKAVKAVNDAAVKLTQNLADLPDKAKARANLGLKAAALRDVGVATGQLVEVGAFGLGASCSISPDANEIGRSGFFGLAAGKHKNSPNVNASWEVLSICYDQGSRKQIFMQAGAATTKTYVRYRSSPGGVWGPFQSYYSSENKPGAADVDAVSASRGGEFKAAIQASGGVTVGNGWQSRPGGLFPGNGDDRTFEVCNVDIKSWYGIGFYNTCPGTGIQGRSIIINVRAGYLEAKGNLKGLGVYDNSGRVYSPGNKPTAADVGALTDAQALQKYALRSIKVNGKPLSGDVNLLAGDINAWNKSEADGRYLMLSGGTVKNLTVKTGSTGTENTALLIDGVEHTPLVLKRSSATANISIGFQLGGGAPLYRLGINDKNNLCWGTEANQAANATVYHTKNKPTAADVNAWNKTEADGRYLMKTGGQLSGIVKTSAEIQSTSPDNYRIVGGSYGAYWRNDGNSLFLLLTNANDQLGKFNSLRPLSVAVTTGTVSFGNGVHLSGGWPAITTSTGTTWHPDGNVQGSCWGGYLSNWLNTNITAAQNNAQNWAYQNLVQGVRLSGRTVFRDSGGRIDVPSGCVYTGMSGANYDPNIWGAYSAMQVLINGRWATVGTV